ncbi:sulfatase family protein [Chryseobacterium lathyri]|uniref:sulfatase family protein n=1 Tax=Chryseobacterium lathyri TaxID=395933 RepID=UPI002785E634|nr:sulfatase [Chryseobacterium lathyri]MDQ0064396.1 arylsulfatase A-like enzyme [Chryseobacterium lathyri]
MYKRKLLLLTLVAAFQMSYAQKKPNIIYIMTDDHSYQTISAYGSKVSKLAPTPNIDRLAKEGILFEKAFVENSLCTPSRAALMTGLYSHQNGQKQLAEGIDSTKVFFSESLHDVGYQTAIVGKWHMSTSPKGFDYYNILDDQGKYYNPTFKSKMTNDKYVQEKGYATKLITQHSLEFLNSRDKNKPFLLMVHHKAPHRNWMPELQYLNLYENTEFPVPENFWDDYVGKGVAAKNQKMTISKDLELVQDLKVGELNAEAKTPYDKFSFMALSGELDRLTPEERVVWDKFYKPRNEKFLKAKLTGKELVLWKYQNYMRDYERVVKSVDDSVGEILDYLDKNPELKENTIVVYTSDQGFYMGEHNYFDKRFMYEESFRTPLLMRYPKGIKAGTQSQALVQNIDFAPTFISMAGAEKSPEMPGNTLEPLFSGKEPKDWRNSLYYHYYDYPAFHLVRKHDGVRTERYKLIHFYGEGGLRAVKTKFQTTPGYREHRVLELLKKVDYIPEAQDINYNELYDLKKDPNEMNNLYGKPGYEKITAELQTRLDQYRQDLNVTKDEY